MSKVDQPLSRHPLKIIESNSFGFSDDQLTTKMPSGIYSTDCNNEETLFGQYHSVENLKDLGMNQLGRGCRKRIDLSCGTDRELQLFGRIFDEVPSSGDRLVFTDPCEELLQSADRICSAISQLGRLEEASIKLEKIGLGSQTKRLTEDDFSSARGKSVCKKIDGLIRMLESL